MYQMDSQRRLNLTSGLIELSEVGEEKKVVLAYEGGTKYRVVPAEKIPAEARIVTPRISIDKKGRMIIPKHIADQYKEDVLVYVQGMKLYIEFNEK